MRHLHHLVSALVDGELDGRARDRALAHARRCRPCRDEIVQTLTVKQRLRGLGPAEPSADLFSSLAGLSPAPDEPAARARAGRTRRVLAATGTVSAAVVALAYAVGGAGQPASAVVPPVDEFSAEFAGAPSQASLADPSMAALSSSFLAAGRGRARTSPDVRTARASSRLGSFLPAEIGPGEGSGPEHAALNLLERAVSAPERLSYVGIREVTVHGPGGVDALLRVHHVSGQGTTYDVAGRRTSGVSTFIAEGDVHGLADRPVGLLAASYHLSVSGADVVAGRAATVVEADSGGVAAARFWIDDATGILLKHEVYDDGRLARGSGFVDVQVFRQGFLDHLPPQPDSPRLTLLPKRTALALEDEGWACPDKLAGSFSLVSLARMDDRGDVVHAAYSDGVSRASLFEEPGSLDESALAGFTAKQTSDGQRVYQREGLPTVVVWESGDMVYTLVTDAPPSTADSLVAALPHEPVEDDGVGARLGTGLGRIGAFLNPVG